MAPHRRQRPATRQTPPGRKARAGPNGLIERLTQRELDVVRLVARGRTNEELSTELYVTLSTVKAHLGDIQRKLTTRNRVEIAAWAWEKGICTGDQDGRSEPTHSFGCGGHNATPDIVSDAGAAL
ncbi:putative two-component system response regulator [Streptomyces sp. 769]|nr:putative two-component system response regulator [Streptomyces sp. 769]